jgi:hypothetical protein
VATVELHLMDVEPVLVFITRAVRAEAWTQHVTPEQMAALPEPMLAAVLLLQSAVRDLGGEVPSMAGVLARCPCGHGEDDICLNGLIYGSCGNENCGGGCDPDAGTCYALPGCCDQRRKSPVVAPPASRALP